MTHPASDYNPDLVEQIREKIAACGGIPFAEFMRLCLYAPEHGYYMAARQRVGKGGDFYTSSCVSSAFGRLLARQLVQMWQLLGAGPFAVAEQGAGEGHLAADILAALREEAPELYRQVRYHLIEISPDSRARQEQLLAEHGDRVVWCDLDALQGMEGCFLSNELVDAFPVHLVEWRDGALKEVFVVCRDGGFGEDLRSPSSPDLGAHLRRLGARPAEGSRGEINLNATAWMRKVGRLLRRGFVVTIDYGYPATELYAPFRRNGTLMCYWQHQASEDPYARVGLQDITAHVDFTALQQAGREEGLESLFLGEQYRFLMGLGFVELLMDMQAREPDERRRAALRLTLKNLVLPDGGMGDLFKVLVQGKGVGSPRLLCQRRLEELHPSAAPAPRA